MLTSLTGCALIVPDNTKALEEKAIEVGSTVISKQEVVDLWYTFYKENSSAFYSYENDYIAEVFYKNIVLKYAMIQETNKLIEADKLVYSAGDDAKVWLNVLNSVYSSVDTNEKALYTQQGLENEELPTRLQTSSSTSNNSDVKSYLYTDYNFKGMEDYECKYTPENNTGNPLNGLKVGKSVTDQKVNQIIEYIDTYLYKAEVELDEDEEIDPKDFADLKAIVNSTDYYTDITGDLKNRQKAYEMFVGNLMLTAKAEGKAYDRKTVLFNKIKEAYINAYESYLNNMYTSYVKSLINQDIEGNNYYALNKQSIVARYLQLVGSDIQNYKLEENYIAVLEGEASNTLLLYRFNGEYYYFTVQHLLVSFDDKLVQDLAELPGNDSTASKEQFEFYEKARAEYYKELGLNNWSEYNNATYRDENGYDVYTYTDAPNTYMVYFDKSYTLPEVAEDTAEDEKPTAYYYIDNADNETKVYLNQGQFDTCKKATVTVGKVLEEFNSTYTTTLTILRNNYSKAPSEIKDLLDENTDVKYSISEDLIYDCITALKDKYNNSASNDAKIAELNHKVYTNLFMQHSFKYSADAASLGTDLSDYVGMIISGRPDNNKVGGNTYVSEFTNGARKLASKYLTNKDNAALNDNKIETSISADNFVISDYGIHMIVVNDVYKVTESAAITGKDFSSENIFGEGLTQQQINEKVDAAIAEMESIYVSSTSSQTLYEYMYELIRDELVGSNGTIMRIEQNRLYKQYIDQGIAKLDGKLSYDELMDYMNK